MQTIAGNPHVINYLCGVKGSKLHPQSLGVLRLYASGLARLKETLKSLVPE
jgi:hypothetical protein